MKNTIIQQGIELILGLDANSEKNVRKKIEQLVSNDYELDFNTAETQQDIQELTKAFQKIFETVGNKSVDWDKILISPAREAFEQLKTIIQTSFQDVISQIDLKKNFNTSNVLSQISDAEQRKAELKEKAKKATKKYDYYEYLNDSLYMQPDEFKPLKAESDLDAQADRIMNEFVKAEDALSETTRGTKEYYQALVKAIEATSNLYRMSRTVSQNSDKFKDKSWIEEYAPVNLAETTADIFDASSDYESYFRTKIAKQYEKTQSSIKAELEQIDAEIIKLKKDAEQAYPEKAAQQALKSLEEIEAAQRRITTQRGTLNKTKSNTIRSAIEYTPGENSLTVLKNRYDKSLANNEDWEMQYSWLVKFVKEYESLQSNGNISKDVAKHFGDFYNLLKPMYSNANAALESLAERSGIVTGAVKEEAQAHIENSNAVQKEKESKETLQTANEQQVESQVPDAVTKEAQAHIENTGAIKEEAEAKKVATEGQYTSGSILSNPLFSNMFKASKQDAEAVEETEHKITEEIAEQNKLLLYRRVDGQLDTDRLGHWNANSDNITNLQETLEYGFGGFGDGMFATTADAASNLLANGDVSYFEFDASRYKLYINETQEQAEALQSFLLSLQKFVAAGTLLDTSTLTHIEDKNPEQLYQQASSIFKDFSMSEAEFTRWLIDSMNEAAQISEALKNGQEVNNTHNFGTRFMQKLGYEGVVNRTGNVEDFDGMYQGSVIFDPNVADIVAYLDKYKKIFKSTQEFAAYLKSLGVDSTQDDIIDDESLKPNAVVNEGEVVVSQESLDVEKQKTSELETQNEALEKELRYQESIQKALAEYNVVAENRADEAEEEVRLAAEKAKQLEAAKEQAESELETLKEKAQLLEDNVQITENIPDNNVNTQSPEESVKIGELRALLESITYNVNSTTEEQAPWALEQTMQSRVIPLLDKIATQEPKNNGTPAPAESSESVSDSKKEPGKKKTTAEDIENQRKELELRRRMFSLESDQSRLQAIRDAETNPEIIEALNAEIGYRQRLIDLQRAGIKEDVKTEQYTKKILALRTAETRRRVTEEERRDVRQSKSDAGIGLARSTLRQGQAVALKGSEGFDEENQAKVSQYITELEKLDAIYEKVNSNKGVVSEEDKKALLEQTALVQGLTPKIKALVDEYARLSGPNSEVIGSSAGFTGGLDDARQIITEAVQSMSGGQAIIKSFNYETGELNYEIQTGAHEFVTYTAAIRKADNAIVSLAGNTRHEETFLEAIKRKTMQISTYLTGSMSVMRIFTEIRRGVGYVKEIDLALTELKKVTDETDAAYAKFLKDAAEASGRIGSTISDFTNATAEFARLGYTIKQASAMAEAAIVYKNVGDGIESVQAASESLISTLKAFGIEANNTMGIVDRFNEVGNNFAISSKGVGDALMRSASALSAAGNTIDESIGIITAANSVVQDPASVGTALKTLSMRLRGTKTELEAAGEDTEGMANSVSSLQAKLLSLSHGKVNIMADKDTFKNTTEILREMSAAWQDMTDIERASALELMGGKRQANILSAIIQNFDIVEDAIKTSQTASGSALRENAKYLDSIQGKIDLLTNSLQVMWSNALDSDAIKFLVSAGTQLVNIIDKLGLIQSLFIALGTYFKGKTAFKGIAEGIRGVAAGLSDVGKSIRSKIQGAIGSKVSSQESGESIGDLRAELDQVQAKMVEVGQGNQGYAELAKQAEELAHKLRDVSDGAEEAGNAGALAGKKIAQGFKQALTSLKAVAKQLLTMYAITAIVDLTSKGLETLFSSSENEADSIDALNDKFTNSVSELNEVSSELTELNTKLDNVNDRIDTIKSQGHLSFTDQEELDRLQKESEELERQISLNETLQKSKQTSVNENSVAASKKYLLNTSFESEKTKADRQAEGKETGSSWGSVIGMGLGLLASFIPGVNIGALALMGAGSVLGSFAGGAIGSATSGSSYDSEQSVGDAIKNMRERRAQLLANQEAAIAENDTEAYNEATEALANYDNQMAQHISQLSEYANSFDWETGTEEEKKQVREILDMLDKYNIEMGAEGAKSSAIARLFGDNAVDEAKQIKDLIDESISTGKELDLDSILSDDKLKAFVFKLHEMGLTLTEIIGYFKDVEKAQDEAMSGSDITGVISQMSSLAEHVDVLKTAFAELVDVGKLTASTLASLQEKFKDVDGWEDFAKKVGTGTKSLKEQEEAFRELANSYAAQVVQSGSYNQEEYWTYVSTLGSMGVKNAKQYIDAAIKKNATEYYVQQLENGSTPGIALEKTKSIYGEDAIDDGLIEAATKKQAAHNKVNNVQKEKNAYDAAVEKKKEAEERIALNNQRAAEKLNDLAYGAQLVKEAGTADAYAAAGNYVDRVNAEAKEISEAIAADQEIVDAELPVEVTDVEITNAQEAADKADAAYEDALKDTGFEMEVEVYTPSDYVDNVQSIFDTLASAQKEYNENGFFSVDTMQNLIQMSPKYLSMLYDEMVILI